VSPSAQQSTFTPSPRSAQAASSTSGHSSFSISSLSKRRNSQQPRKSVKELEAEYHDSDEELPDDAVIWNIPLSPRPPHERDITTFVAKRADADPLAGRAIERSASSTSNLSAPGAIQSPESVCTARSPSLPSIPQSPNLGSEPGVDYRLQNSKTWDAALSDLSTEAREITEALEAFAEAAERQHESAVQSGQAKPPSAKSPRVSASAIELPPMRKNDPLLDPLPVSKEKERFLSRTRPSWLPPKSAKEEKKHLKEYQKMMAKAEKAERVKQRQAEKEMCARDSVQEALAKRWDEHVLPNWAAAIREPTTRDMWWKGVPAKRRGEIWKLAVGNPLGLVEGTYDTALKRAREAEQRLEHMSSEEVERDATGKALTRLRENADNVFPDVKIFQEGGPLHQSLLDVCMAYAMYRADLDCVTRVQVSLVLPFSILTRSGN
jgi:hypothetical protein